MKNILATICNLILSKVFPTQLIFVRVWDNNYEAGVNYLQDECCGGGCKDCDGECECGK